MKNQNSSIVFDQERASSYDQQRVKMAPMKDALHFFIRMLLSELPANARILCVGVGTGAELIDLAQAFPRWRFTAVDPAAPMLDICRQRAEKCGIASRCTFHEGYLETLPETEPFDAATCILVSHFFTKSKDRRNFFREIAARLRPDGYLVNADLAADMSASAYQSLLELWLRTLKYSDLPAEAIKKFEATNGQNVTILPPHDVELILASSGFDTPALFLQTGLIHAWCSKRAG